MNACVRACIGEGREASRGMTREKHVTVVEGSIGRSVFVGAQRTIEEVRTHTLGDANTGNVCVRRFFFVVYTLSSVDCRGDYEYELR